MRRLFHEAGIAKTEFAVNTFPAHSSNGFGIAIRISTNSIAMQLSGWIINDLFIENCNINLFSILILIKIKSDSYP